MRKNSRKLKLNREFSRSNRGKQYVQDNYRNCNISDLNSMDFCRQNWNYNSYSKYKYTNTLRRPTRYKDKRKFSTRPMSPVLGSEEYMTKKIEQTSAIIMRQLLNPSEQPFECMSQSSSKDNEDISDSKKSQTESSSSSMDNNKSKTKKAMYNIDEIHEKIMNHITKLNDGKKKNLINSSMSGYDAAIGQIQKQKRLEISRALRVMCSQSKETIGTSSFINSIIPDIGIKIEDLPHDIIEELRKTLDIDSEWSSDDLCLNNFSSSESSLGLNELYSDKCVFAIKTEPNEICIKSEPIDFDDRDNQNSKNSVVNIKRNIFDVTNNDTDGTTITVKKEITEHLESEFDSEHPNERNSNEKNYIISNERHEIFPDSNYNRDILYGQTKNGENAIEPDKLDSIHLPDSFTRMKACDTPAIKNNQGQHAQRSSVLENTIEMIRNEPISVLTWHVKNMSTQTEEENETDCAEKFINNFLSKCYKEKPKNVSEAIRRMLEIDQYILKLTNYRQSIFTDMNSIQSTTISSTKDKKRKTRFEDVDSVSDSHGINDLEQPIKNNTPGRNYTEKNDNIESRAETVKVKPKLNIPRKCSNKKSKFENNADCLNNVKCKIIGEVSLKSKGKEEGRKFKQPKLLKLLDLHEKILVIKVVEDKLVAGTESGKIIFCDLESGQYCKILHVCQVPITSLLFMKQDDNPTCMYVGSFDNSLKIYNIHNYSIVETVLLDDKIQCMECNWGYIFIGCIGGSLLRYTLKKKAMEFEDKYSDNSILVLKATQEGARRVLLVGSRNSPVCIRDAMTGLYMRTMEDVISPTVYSLILENSLVYCGTTNHDILVYSFHNGKLINRYKATGAKGIGCMKIDKNLLFASCHNGSIYVYNIKEKKFISIIRGPGGVILSMEILENQVIIGTMSFKFVSLPIPQHILQQNI